MTSLMPNVNFRVGTGAVNSSHTVSRLVLCISVVSLASCSKYASESGGRETQWYGKKDIKAEISVPVQLFFYVLLLQ